MQIGDWVIDSASRATVRVLEKLCAFGMVSYRVFDPTTGKVYKASEEQLQTNDSAIRYDENYLRYVTLLSKIKNETAGGLLSSLADGLIPLPHQLHVLNRVLERNTVRYILADEVGLGKTIEAGMVIRELKTRGLIRRVLVVCPTGLVTQWAAEMQEKFHEKFHIILPSDYDAIRRLTDSDDVYGQYDQVISPMDSIKPLEKRTGWDEERIARYNEERIDAIINSGWDLVVIDEAHRVAGSSGEVARYKLGHLLSMASPYLLLLSATPHNGKTEPFLRLVRLLDEEAFPNARSVVKEQVAPYLIRTEKREAIDNNGNKLFKNRITHLVSMHWDSRHTFQRELYERVTEYVSKTYNKAKRDRQKNMCLIFLLIITQRMVTSSTAAVRRSLERRLETLQKEAAHYSSMSESELAELDTEDGVEEATQALSLNTNEEIAQLQEIIEIAKQAEYQYPDVKVEKLLDTIEALLNADPQQKVIIFTEFVATQEYLQRILTQRNYTVSTLNGSMSIEERNDALREFREKTNIFISTDAGGEGLNLQFSNIIINYDLPWNPMKIEQRCGRADRIGQTRDVQIFNFIIDDTVESRVRTVLEEKLSVILKEIGVDKYSDVLDSEVAEIDFTAAYMRSISQPARIEEALRPVEQEVRQQMENMEKYKDVIREDKDLTQLVGAENSFEVEPALRMALAYYNAWQDKENALIDVIGINDAQVTKHLKAEITQDRVSPILSVSIADFPNEAGYFMLWELSLTDSAEDRKIIPIFINDNQILRPLAGKRIMDVFLNPGSLLQVHAAQNLSSEQYAQLEQQCMEFAFDTFEDMKDKYLRKNKDVYQKYMYALRLRTEAAYQIGIENIRQSKLIKLQQEKETIEENYRKGQQVYPDFRLMLLVRLEA